MTGWRSPVLNEPDVVNHTGFLLAEDEAVKQYFTGLTVPTSPGRGSGTTEVGVWFRHPEGERQIKYPFITIDMIDIAPAYDLWTSEHWVNPEGLYQPSLSPDLPVPDDAMGLHVRPYLPFRLSYQVAVHCRSALHDRYLTSKFFTDIIPPRPFWMGVDADNTWRRCDMLDFIQADLAETTESGNKRIFRKIYTISMLSEIPQDRITQVWQVLRVYVPIQDRDTLDQMFLPELPVADFDESPSSDASATAAASNASITIS